MRVLTSIGLYAVVLADQGGPPGVKGLTIKSQPDVTVRNMTLPDGLSATGTTGLHLMGNMIGTTTLLNDSGSVLNANTMARLTLNHSTNPSVTGNTINGNVAIISGTSAPVLSGNTISGNVQIGDATPTSNAQLLTNTIGGSVKLKAGAATHVRTNTTGSPAV